MWKLNKPSTVGPLSLFMRSLFSSPYIIAVSRTSEGAWRAARHAVGLGSASPRFTVSVCLGSPAAGELQEDGEEDRRRPPAVQRRGRLLPGEGQDREELRPAAEGLGPEVEGRSGEG